MQDSYSLETHARHRHRMSNAQALEVANEEFAESDAALAVARADIRERKATLIARAAVLQGGAHAAN